MLPLPYNGRLLNTIILLVVNLSAFSLSWSILKSKPKEEKIQYFGHFWLATAFLWLSSTIRNLFAAFDLLALDQFFFYGTQIFVFLSGVFLGPYIAMEYFRNKKIIQIFIYAYRVLAVAGIALILFYGVHREFADEYSTDYVPASRAAQIIFLVAIGPLLVLSIIGAARRAHAYVRGSGLLYKTLGPLSIALYLIIGLIDQEGLLASWRLNLFRLVFLISFLIAYAAVLQQRTAEEAQNPNTAFEI